MPLATALPFSPGPPHTQAPTGSLGPGVRRRQWAARAPAAPSRPIPSPRLSLPFLCLPPDLTLGRGGAGVTGPLCLSRWCVSVSSSLVHLSCMLCFRLLHRSLPGAPVGEGVVKSASGHSRASRWEPAPTLRPEPSGRGHWMMAAWWLDTALVPPSPALPLGAQPVPSPHPSCCPPSATGVPLAAPRCHPQPAASGKLCGGQGSVCRPGRGRFEIQPGGSPVRQQEAKGHGAEGGAVCGLRQPQSHHRGASSRERPWGAGSCRDHSPAPGARARGLAVWLLPQRLIGVGPSWQRTPSKTKPPCPDMGPSQLLWPEKGRCSWARHPSPLACRERG